MSATQSPSTRPSSPGILPSDAPPTNLRYWDGSQWVGGPVASIWSRVWGNVIDVVLASIVFLVVFVILAIPAPMSEGPNPVADPTWMNVAFLVAIVVGFAGYFVLNYRFWGKTVGMVASGTYLVHIPTGTQRLPWGSAVLRSVILTIGYACGILWAVWLLIAGLSKTKQGPHDLVAKTGVLSSRQGAPDHTPAPVPTQVAVESAAPTVAVDAPSVSVVESTTTPSVAAGATAATTMALADPPTSTTIFISHASADADVARSLAAALEAQGIGTWLADRDVTIGSNYAAEIFQNLVQSNYLLVVLSSTSIESAHVRREVSIAIDRKVPVLPVSIDPSGELMANLPEDWQYWLNIAQVFRMTDEDSTANEIARRVR